MFENYIGGCENLSSPHLKKEKHFIWMVKKGKKGAHEYTQHADVTQSCFRGCDATVKLRSNNYINVTDASIKMQLIIKKKLDN